MSLLGLGNKKETSCCCGSVIEKAENSCCSSINKEVKENCYCGTTADGICCIKVLASGCKSCHALFENTKKAVSEVGLTVDVEYVTDMEKIMEYGVMSIPALVINEKVVVMGKVLKTEEVKKYLV